MNNKKTRNQLVLECDSFIKDIIFQWIDALQSFPAYLELLHCNYNSNYDPKNSARDCLFKIIPVIDHVTRKCKGVYTPDKHVAIDEELVLWMSRLGFKQYISTLRQRISSLRG